MKHANDWGLDWYLIVWSQQCLLHTLCHNGTFTVQGPTYLMKNKGSNMQAEQLSFLISPSWITMKQNLLHFKQTLGLPASLCVEFWNHCLVHYSTEDCASYEFETNFIISYRSCWQGSQPFLCFRSLFAAGADLPDTLQLYLHCNLCGWNVYKGRTAFILTVIIALIE